MGFYNVDTGGKTVLNPNTWYHIVWRYDKSTKNQALFVNGRLDGNQGDRAPFIGTGNVYLGKWSPGSEINGSIDEVEIYDRALSDAEISALFNGGKPDWDTKNVLAMLMARQDIIEPKVDAILAEATEVLGISASICGIAEAHLGVDFYGNGATAGISAEICASLDLENSDTLTAVENASGLNEGLQGVVQQVDKQIAGDITALAEQIKGIIGNIGSPIEYGGLISLRSWRDTYLVAESDGRANSNRTAIGGWERWTILNSNNTGDRGKVRYGDFISLKSFHGKYLVAESDGRANADRTAIGGWEKWTILNPNNTGDRSEIQDGGAIALKSFHGKHLVAEGTGFCSTCINLDVPDRLNHGLLILCQQ